MSPSEQPQVQNLQKIYLIEETSSGVKGFDRGMRRFVNIRGFLARWSLGAFPSSAKNAYQPPGDR